MKNQQGNASQTFRATFKKVRRELSKFSGLGFAFALNEASMKRSFREAMIAAGVPSTARRIELVNNWVSRASSMTISV